MQQIGEIAKNHKYIDKKGEEKEMLINAIPNNMKKYMAFMLGHNLVFTDSFQFMSSSLDNLMSNLPRESLTHTSEVFKGKALDLMSKKGIYPFDHMDSFESLMKQNYLQKNNFIVLSMMNIFLKMIISMLTKFGKDLISRIWENIMIYIYCLIFCNYLMFLKISEKHVLNIIKAILLIILLLLDYHGMVC